MATSQRSEGTRPQQRRRLTILLWFFVGLIPIGLLFLAIKATAFANINSLGSLNGVGFVLAGLGIIGAVITAISRSPDTIRPSPPPAVPIGHRPDGQPIYDVVGYTPDGKLVTADSAVRYRPSDPRTNSLAVVALVLGLVFPLLAIPVAIAARTQIRRSGEQGDGLALAGLILGYISLLTLLVIVMIFVLNAG